MKKNLLLIVVCLVALAANAQKIIPNPLIGRTTAYNLTIKSVELTDSTTTINFEYHASPGMGFSIPTKSYIEATGSKERLFLKRTLKVPTAKQVFVPQSGSYAYSIVFPALPPSASAFNFGEGNNGGDWFIDNIQLKSREELSMIPSWLAGDWFDDASQECKICFLDSVAIYQLQVWHYEQVDLKKQKGSIRLRHGEQSLSLKVKGSKNSTCEFADNNGTTQTLSKTPGRNHIPADAEGLQEIHVKMDTCLLHGYIANYSPVEGKNTFSIYFNDVFIGDQITKTITIQPDGSFSKKIALPHPQYLFCQSQFFGRQLYLEPGKDLFILVRQGESTRFLGESGRVNEDLSRLIKIDYQEYQEIQAKILEGSANDYKQFLLSKMNTKLQELDDSAATGRYLPKAIEIARLSNSYSYWTEITGYRMNFDGAYRQAHDISFRDREAVIPADTLDANYFDYLTPQVLNNRQALCTSIYYFFINRMMYLPELSTRNGASSIDCYREMLANNYPFTDSEKESLRLILAVDTLYKTPEFQQLTNELSLLQREVSLKYESYYNEYWKENEGADFDYTAFLNSLEEQGIKDEKITKLKAIFTAYNELVESHEVTKLMSTHNDSIAAFHTRFQPQVDEYFQTYQQYERLRSLEEDFNIQPGLFTDITWAQTYGRTIYSEMSPLSDEELAEVQQKFVTPEVADYLATVNESSKQTIALNKTKTGYTLNDTPQHAGDEIFERIIEKYKGKVIYVDFWATWCGPCRDGIARIKPLKEQMKDEDVVFVYITNETSPENTWKNMIPDIKGEHYRVSSDDWNYLSERFHISGIPHCALVNREGQVVDPHLGFLSNTQIKNLLEKNL